MQAGRQYAIFLSTLFIAFFCSMGSSSLAQDSTGAVRGVVRQRAGKPLAGAAVAAKHVESGQTQTATSNEEGEFQIRNLPPGIYDVEVSRAGFVTQTKTAVALEANNSIAIQFELQAGPEAENSGSRTSRISESQLVGLPLNGRSYNQLATLDAGITDTGGEQASRGVGGGNLTVAGGRASSNNFLLDGTNIMDTGNRVPQSAAGVQLGSDAVFQVQVLATNFGAEYGRGSGGVLNSITNSGSDKFHGTVFEYFRNSKLDARNFFNRDPFNYAKRSDPPPFKRNQFGFTLGGPILKGRTYFMGNFEAMRDRLSETQVDFFPDRDARNGIINELINGTCRPAAERVQVNPRVQPYLGLFPLPNADCVGGGFGRNFGSLFQPTNQDHFTVRIDHKLSERDSLFARYTFDDASSISAQNTYLFRTESASRQQYATVVATHIFSLSALNNLRLGYTRPVDALTTLSSISIPTSLFFVPGAPDFGQIELPGSAAFGPNTSFPERNVMNTFQFADDVVLQRGAHALKFGVEIHRYRWDVSNASYKGGAWAFNSLLSFLQAGPSGTSLIVSFPGSNNRKSYRQTLAGFYGQDSFRVSSRLQLNLGLRYEFATIISENDGRISYLPDPVHDTTFQVGRMLKDNPSLLNFSPRVGFAWTPYGRDTVFGGGVGIYYDPLLEYAVDLQKNSAPFFRRVVRPSFDSSATFPDAVTAAAGLEATTPFQMEILDYKHIRSPMVLRYNFGVQRSFGSRWRLQAAYVGSRGNHLFRGYEANQYPVPVVLPDGSLLFPPNAGPVNPSFGAVRVTSSDAQSFYNSLQLSAGKSSDKGLSFQASYTFSKSVDDSSSFSSGESTASSRQYPLMRTLDRGLSDFDIRHRLSANYFYAVPFGAGQPWLKSGVLSRLFGGWRLGGIVSIRSGTPFHPQVNVRIPGYLFSATRPNLRPGFSSNPVRGVTAGCDGVRAGEKLGGPDRYFDPCAFDTPPAGTVGNVGRNTIIGPRIFSTDVSIQKDFILRGETRLQFRTEMFNVANHANFAPPTRASSVVTTGFPPRVNGATAGTIIRTATTSRQIQFALRVSF